MKLCMLCFWAFSNIGKMVWPMHVFSLRFFHEMLFGKLSLVRVEYNIYHLAK